MRRCQPLAVSCRLWLLLLLLSSSIKKIVLQKYFWFEVPISDLILNETSNGGVGWDGTYAFPFTISIQTAGNRSLLANDYTQINDLGYGLIATNGALSEQVSTFSYYCYTRGWGGI